MSDSEEVVAAPTPDTVSRQIHKIAFVIDGVVQDIIHTQDRFAAILQSDPVIVNCTGVDDQIVVGQTKFDEETQEFVGLKDERFRGAPLPVDNF